VDDIASDKATTTITRKRLFFLGQTGSDTCFRPLNRSGTWLFPCPVYWSIYCLYLSRMSPALLCPMKKKRDRDQEWAIESIGHTLVPVRSAYSETIAAIVSNAKVGCATAASPFSTK
jgi:hypothetical protein